MKSHPIFFLLLIIFSTNVRVYDNHINIFTNSAQNSRNVMAIRTPPADEQSMDRFAERTGYAYIIRYTFHTCGHKGRIRDKMIQGLYLAAVREADRNVRVAKQSARFEDPDGRTTKSFRKAPDTFRKLIKQNAFLKRS